MRRVPGVIALVAALLAGACGNPATTPSPTPVPSATTSLQPAPTTQPTASPAATPSELDHAVVYFARDRLPPVAWHVDGAGRGSTIEARVLSRLAALLTTEAPRGLFNTALAAKARPSAVSVAGDRLTVDFTVPGGDWGIAGSAGSRAFLQQLIYTATEEPGIRSVLVTENGGQAIIGGEGIVIDHPATREDVSGYVTKASTDPMTWRIEPRPAPVAVTSRITVDSEALGLARFVVDTGLRGAEAKASLGYTASVMRNDEEALPDLGKWVLALKLPGTVSSDDALRLLERTPVRALRTTVMDAGVRYDIGLDDLRPWRIAMLYEPLRIVLDIGGDPDAVSRNIALYRPAFGSIVRAGDQISGLVRAFEARYEYRIHDARGNVIDAFASASLGTAEMWGTFELTLPDLPAGAATIEILLRSPKDGNVSESVFTSVEVAR